MFNFNLLQFNILIKVFNSLDILTCIVNYEKNYFFKLTIIKIHRRTFSMNSLLIGVNCMLYQYNIIVTTNVLHIFLQRKLPITN